MREIIFRAKRKDNGEWVQGCYVHCAVSGKDFIFPKGNEVNESQLISEEGCLRIFCFEVIPETVSQYTSLTDKNGNKIWENDIVFVTDSNGCSGQIDTGTGEIDLLEGLWYISGYVQNSLYDINKCFQIEVIGNVFDNPDLLESEDD